MGGVDAASGGPLTLGDLGMPSQIVLAGDCVVAAKLTALMCVPVAGGPVRTIATLPRTVVSVAADGDGVIATSLPLDFGPSGDRTMHVDRIALDGTVSPLGTAFAGAGAGQLAVSPDQIVFTTGGSASLLTIPRSGGAVKVLASDSGNFGSVAVGGSDAYYVNTSIYRHALASAGGASVPVASLGTGVSLASDGTTVVAVGVMSQLSAVVSILGSSPGSDPIPLAGAPSAVVVTEGRAWMALNGDVISLDLTTHAMTPILSGEAVTGLVVTPTAMFWITDTGAVRTTPR